MRQQSYVALNTLHITAAISYYNNYISILRTVLNACCRVNENCCCRFFFFLHFLLSRFVAPTHSTNIEAKLKRKFYVRVFIIYISLISFIYAVAVCRPKKLCIDLQISFSSPSSSSPNFWMNLFIYLFLFFVQINLKIVKAWNPTVRLYLRVCVCDSVDQYIHHTYMYSLVRTFN